MSPLGNEKIICDLAAVRLGSNDEPAPILLDTTQKMDRKYKDAWENMLDYCDGAVTSDREDWERRGGIIYACPCFQRGRTKKEKRIATSIKEVKIKLGRVVERTHDEKEKQKLEGHLKELSAERERLKEIRGTYWTGWNLRSRAHLEIQEGKKREEDTDIFIRSPTLPYDYTNTQKHTITKKRSRTHTFSLPISPLSKSRILCLTHAHSTSRYALTPSSVASIIVHADAHARLQAFHPGLCDRPEQGKGKKICLRPLQGVGREITAPWSQDWKHNRTKRGVPPALGVPMPVFNAFTPVRARRAYQASRQTTGKSTLRRIPALVEGYCMDGGKQYTLSRTGKCLMTMG